MVVQIWQFNFQFCQFLPSQNLYQWRSAGVSCLIEVLLIIIFSYPYKKPPIKAKIAKVKFNGAKPLSFILGHFNPLPYLSLFLILRSLSQVQSLFQNSHNNFFWTLFKSVTPRYPKVSIKLLSASIQPSFSAYSNTCLKNHVFLIILA